LLKISFISNGKFKGRLQARNSCRRVNPFPNTSREGLVRLRIKTEEFEYALVTMSLFLSMHFHPQLPVWLSSDFCEQCLTAANGLLGLFPLGHIHHGSHQSHHDSGLVSDGLRNGFDVLPYTVWQKENIFQRPRFTGFELSRNARSTLSRSSGRTRARNSL